MKKYYITFRSITFAQRGEQMLKRAGIACILLRTPKVMAKQGCGYTLRLREADFPKAMSMLQEAQISYGRVYVMGEGGIVEEVAI